MARKHKKPQAAPQTRRGPSTISVEAFQDISLLFPGDVYLLAVWIAMSDRAMSTPTAQRGTNLQGLAKHFASLAYSFQQPWTTESVMQRFREHGLAGNPVLRLPPEHAETITARIAGDETKQV